ncbi:MAG: helix-hairpin-helix domain-containing protein [Woeseia sp.]|nr:helix-hairpin-helix domain-containing protein [Woeseia sp.]MBT8097117.1 helix-hairpin-helix domain-containing protein [Woeseia sp.]NNE61673.1 helix-hairpin-helix domain-containing protein [Woeseia sp.]NNL55986.1 helix-hairpin-helix domain-containing protein [Woeseia sp.]
MIKYHGFLLACLAALMLPMLAFAGPVNVNTANADAISTELKGVGLAKAEAIVAYRKAHGPFKSLTDLMLVKGIGARTLEINKDNIILASGKESSRKK